MKWLGLDIECNRRANGKNIWNVGIALFKSKMTIDYYNVFVNSCFSLNKKDSYGLVYLKTREQLSQAKRGIWVETQEDADHLVSTIIRAWGFSRSFGYNSSVFDLQKLQGTYPKTLALLLAKPHVDLMPLVVDHLVGRKSYKAYWEKEVRKGNATEGNADYCKFSAELVLNYIAHIRNKGEWTWKTEDHIGVEDLIYFEYPILHYLMRILKKGMTPTKTSFGPLKWES